MLVFPTFLCLFIMVVVKVDFPIFDYFENVLLYTSSFGNEIDRFHTYNIPTIMLSLSDLCCSKLLSAGADGTVLAKMS